MPPSNLRIVADWQTYLAGILRVFDVLAVVLGGLLAYRWRYDDFELPGTYIIAILLGALLALNFLHLAHVYRYTNLPSRWVQFGYVALGWIGATATLLATAYLTQSWVGFSPTWVLYWWVAGQLLFVLGRGIVLWLLARWHGAGSLKLTIAVVGSGDLARSVVRQLQQTDPNAEFRILGVFSDVDPARTGDIAGVPRRGSIDDLVALSRVQHIDEIFLAVPSTDIRQIDEALNKLRAMPVNCKLCAQPVGTIVPVHGLSYFSGLALLHVSERPLQGWSLVWKTLEDKMLAIVLLIIVFPVMAVIAIVIPLESKGPIVFRQKRYGFNNNEFVVYKFRTMHHDPNPDPEVPQARRNDPRVTRIGAMLRRTSLDELPQLVNVLLGTMSLVGPRPHAVAHNEHYAKVIDGYLARHRVKPGITGWAQVNGLRGETDTPEKMRLRVQSDLYYIDNWSLLLDLKILVRTFFVVLSRVNAH